MYKTFLFSFLLGSFRAFPTLVYKNHTRKDQDRSENLLPGQCFHAHADAHGDGNDGLDITVHADQGRTDGLLGDRDEEIADESSTNDEVGQLCKLFSRERHPIHPDEAG